MSSTTKLITLITGANQGLGYYAAQQFAASGKYFVYLGSRDHVKGQKAVDELVSSGSPKENISAIKIDVTSDESINEAVAQVDKEFGRLDILINNAGISTLPSAPTPRAEWTAIYDTNVFGAALTTESFLPLLRKSTLPSGKRLIFTGSSLSSMQMALNPAHPNYAARNYTIYRSTKTALNMVMAGFADRLDEEGFVTTALCPGYCGTNLNGFAGYKDPREGAKVIVLAAERAKEEVQGKLIYEDGAYPW